MSLLIEMPTSFTPERHYILEVLLGEFLGLEWHQQSSNRDDVRITLAGHPKGAITLPDIFFKMPESLWLNKESLPPQPLSYWDSRELEIPITLIDPSLPVIYGADNVHGRVRSDEIYIPIDIFGSAFFMLSRYEELVIQDRDEHNRFPAWASLAYKESFLGRPIVDEYIEVFWAILYRLWPQLVRKKRNFQINVSHDVDRPSRYKFSSTRKYFRALGGDIIKRRDWRSLIAASITRYSQSDCLHRADPYNTFEWIMDVSERHGLKSAFYFICGRTHPELDADYDPGHPAIRALMRRIYERGHEIGLHPSYNTYRDPDALMQEANRLRDICSKEGIHQSHFGGRMHYLRWDQAITPRACDAAGISYDSTLAYADRAGFRCGTCFEFPAFDMFRRTMLNLRLRPLIAMEGSIFCKEYMGLNDLEAEEYLIRLRDRVELMSGTFTLLWHNSEFVNDSMRNLYSRLLRPCSKTA